MNQDPFVFERFKRLVVNTAISKTQQPRHTQRVGSKLEVLYISRQANGSGHRLLTNDSHTRLVNILERDFKDKMNVKIVKMEGYSAEEQIQMASNADIIIGVHGNGLTNTLWMPKGGLVIEMFPASACMFHFQWVTIMSSQEYAGISGNIIFPAFTRFVREPCLSMMQKCNVNQVFDVNVTLVHQVLLRHISRGNSGLLSCSYVLRD